MIEINLQDRKRLTVTEGIYGCQGEGIVREFGTSMSTLLYFKWMTNKVPRWLSGKESACQCRRHEFNPWVGKMPWSRKWQPTPVFLPGKSHGQRSLVDYSPPGHGESDTTKWLSMNRGIIAQHIKLRTLPFIFFSYTAQLFYNLFSWGQDLYLSANFCKQIFKSQNIFFSSFCPFFLPSFFFSFFLLFLERVKKQSSEDATGEVYL